MPININLLREAIRTHLETDDLLGLLDRAIRLIPQEQIPELIEGFFDAEMLTDDNTAEPPLLDAVQHFYDASLAGYYYEDFAVNSKNFMDQSRGTINFIAEHQRLTHRCVQENETSKPHQIRQAFDLLFDLLDQVDECRDDIVFFADEGGAWQIGVKWDQVLPCYFKALATVTKSKEFAEKVINIVKAHADYYSDQYFQLAIKVAKPSQIKALKARLANM